MIRDKIFQHKLPTFITGAIVVAVILVAISMNVYYSSDAFRLDLSRPEYVPLRDKIDQAPKHSEGFSAQGEVTPESIDEFLEQYRKEVEKVSAVPAFQSDVLDDSHLELTE